MGYEDLKNRIEKDFWRFLQNQGIEKYTQSNL